MSGRPLPRPTPNTVQADLDDLRAMLGGEPIPRDNYARMALLTRAATEKAAGVDWSRRGRGKR